MRDMGGSHRMVPGRGNPHGICWLTPGRTHLGGPGVRARLSPTNHPLHPIEILLGAASCGREDGEGE